MSRVFGHTKFWTNHYSGLVVNWLTYSREKTTNIPGGAIPPQLFVPWWKLSVKVNYDHRLTQCICHDNVGSYNTSANSSVGSGWLNRQLKLIELGATILYQFCVPNWYWINKPYWQFQCIFGCPVECGRKFKTLSWKLTFKPRKIMSPKSAPLS